METLGAVPIQITSAEIDGQLINAPDNTAFYINVPETGKRYYIPAAQVRNGNISISVRNDSSGNSVFQEGRNHTLQLVRDWGPVSPHTVICNANAIVTVPDQVNETCSISSQVTKNSGGGFNVTMRINAEGLRNGGAYAVRLDSWTQWFSGNGVNQDFVRTFEADRAGQRQSLYVYANGCQGGEGACAICSAQVFFDPDAAEVDIVEDADDFNDVSPDALPAGVETEDEVIDDFQYCLQVPEGVQRTNCLECVADEEGARVYTAVGCIQTNGKGLTEDLIRLLMGVSGGVALLSILAGAFLFTVSQGDSSKLKEAKALLTAAVTGLFFIIFSVFILQFVGVSILQIPGLG
ncbi:pilin [Candidatus Woesebacteria bacterium]|nr:pilin [Candidatus Woesebacteria bacterium]MCD8507404.1 pilin [Candidatus Woesebacteria bacterium]MCD8546091.1 pilin [Candidatus Woesebacteria bacterium]